MVLAARSPRTLQLPATCVVCGAFVALQVSMLNGLRLRDNKEEDGALPMANGMVRGWPCHDVHGAASEHLVQKVFLACATEGSSVLSTFPQAAPWW